MHHANLERIQMTATPRIDGRLNVYFVFAALALVLAAPGRLAYVGALAGVVALGVDAAGGRYLRVVRLPAYFLLPSVGVVLLFTAGPPAVSLGPLSVSGPGVDRSITVGLRSFGSVAMLGYLVVTTTIPQLFAALRSLRCPRFAVDISLLTYRAVQILMAERGRLELAAKSRLGFRTRLTTLRTAKSLSISLFLKSLSRAEALDDAMATRAYDGVLPTPTRESRGYGYAVAVLALIAVTGWGV
jgi:cobalt/nickel transport system permease protein